MVKVKDLKEQINTPHPRSFLKCFVCDAEYSANAGDYFLASPDTILKCCGEPLERVKRIILYRRQ